MWRSEVNVRCLLSFSTLVLRQEGKISLNGHTGWLASSRVWMTFGVTLQLFKVGEGAVCRSSVLLRGWSKGTPLVPVRTPGPFVALAESSKEPQENVPLPVVWSFLS